MVDFYTVVLCGNNLYKVLSHHTVLQTGASQFFLYVLCERVYFILNILYLALPTLFIDMSY